MTTKLINPTLNFMTLPVLMTMLALSGCHSISKTDITKPQQTKTSPAVLGKYVSDGYSKRAEGYDWVAVSVSKADSDTLNIRVRSRTDIKKPTCTFDALAHKLNDATNTTYETIVDGKSILFQFANNNLSISTKQDADKNLLYFYCSGGASLAGSYQKL